MRGPLAGPAREDYKPHRAPRQRQGPIFQAEPPHPAEAAPVMVGGAADRETQRHPIIPRKHDLNGLPCVFDRQPC
ncbi:hypothetical protein L345_14030 [Ophiophagus hannah]|uniref:Uncharacterized protein n=1 Tax=Ophiophagus hannah TaxID=8665 RepID=V8ND75_OPHHA|nr:hypothetical protein L345_14030 [Ophiophagus hannah]